MGYQTYYKLEILDAKTRQNLVSLDGYMVDFPEHMVELELELRRTEYRRIDGVMCEESCKWYEHIEDLTKLSAAHPDYIFVLEGVGEEASDHWKRYFLEGENLLISPSIVWPEPDLDSLAAEVRIVKSLKMQKGTE